VIEPGAVAVFSPGKSANEIDDAAEKQDAQRQNCAQLNHDGIHLPVGVIERNFHQRFGDAQVRRRTDRQKLGQAFHNAEQNGLKILVQEPSGVQLFNVAESARRFRACDVFVEIDYIRRGSRGGPVDPGSR